MAPSLSHRVVLVADDNGGWPLEPSEGTVDCGLILDAFRQTCSGIDVTTQNHCAIGDPQVKLSKLAIGETTTPFSPLLKRLLKGEGDTAE